MLPLEASPGRSCLLTLSEIQLITHSGLIRRAGRLGFLVNLACSLAQEKQLLQHLHSGRWYLGNQKNGELVIQLTRRVSET